MSAETIGGGVDQENCTEMRALVAEKSGEKVWMRRELLDHRGGFMGNWIGHTWTQGRAPFEPDWICHVLQSPFILFLCISREWLADSANPVYLKVEDGVGNGKKKEGESSSRGRMTIWKDLGKEGDLALEIGRGATLRLRETLFLLTIEDK